MTRGSIVWRPIVEVIGRERRFVVATHENPDGDATGSSIAIARYLRDAGKTVNLFVPSPADERFQFLARDIEVEVYEPSLHEDAVRTAGAFLILDTSQWNLLGSLAAPIAASSGIRVVIDHHRGPSDLGQIAAIDSDASSTAELVLDLLETMGASIDAVSAASLFAALATDTGWFRFQRVGPEVFRAAAGLLARGISAYDLYTRIFESRSWTGLRLLGETLEGIEPRLGGRAAFLRLDRETFQRISADTLSTEALLDFGLSVGEVEVCVLLREIDHRRVKVSLRSKGRIDVAALAARLGGGGHHNAAGVLLEGSLARAADTVEASLHPLLHAIPIRPRETTP